MNRKSTLSLKPESKNPFNPPNMCIDWGSCRDQARSARRSKSRAGRSRFGSPADTNRGEGFRFASPFSRNACQAEGR